jgi:hypothetical protein
VNTRSISKPKGCHHFSFIHCHENDTGVNRDKEKVPALQNKLFDHKAISLSFKAIGKPITIPIISNSILKDPETDFVVGLAVAETYINYSTAITEEERTNLRLGCGRAWSSLRDAGPRNVYAAPGNRSELEELTREAKIADVREFLEFFPFETTRDGTLSIEDDIFMECLINSIKNETISHQTFVKKNSQKNRANLVKKITDLKERGLIGTDAFLEYESILNKQMDLEMRAELENLNCYEYLNDEKITPYFISLAKSNKAIASTDTICDNDGIPFRTATDRNNCVKEFYSKLYSIPPDEPPNIEDCIEEFLGPEILNSCLVQDSKVPPIRYRCWRRTSPLRSWTCRCNKATGAQRGWTG